jgi:NADH-quinone oxidoreductase subunit G
MAVITIDQKQFEVDPQKNLLETAISLGLEIPYFCWHPSLGSVGSCRLCAVQQMADENDPNGRTVMACMTPCKDQSRFSFVHKTAQDFRSSVVEWLMTNHPHDCPVCDEGGECHLQDMTLLSGHNYREYRFLKRTHKNQNLGPFINHEMNRCITCYRCVRYYKDVAGGTDLGAFKSSGKVYFGRFEEGPFKSEFSGNLVEICPTGVFTDKPYHQNYVRKWDLATSPSICQLCSSGCNISLGEKGGSLRRVQNRYHEDINGFFICDRGRFAHDFVNSDKRLTKYTIKENGEQKELDADTAMARVKELLSCQKVIGIGSAEASLEANFMLKKLVGPDNFYDASAKEFFESSNEVFETLSAGFVEPASLKDIRASDAVFIIGEDVTNTAPIIALAIRQAAQAFKQKASKAIGIDSWNDAAIRDYARGDLLPIFSINALSTSLDSICHGSLITHPWQIPQVVENICDAVENKPLKNSPEHKDFISKIKEAFLKAKNPVIIAGTSLGDLALIKQARKFSSILSQKSDARLSLVMPDANTMGLKLLRPKNLLQTAFVTQKESVDVAIVLEQDLEWRIGCKTFLAFCQNVKNLIVLDSLNRANALVIPVASFLESSGTLISSEGRMQRFYGAAPPRDLKSSFHVLASLMGKELLSIDDISQELARDIGIDHQNFEKLFDHEFRVLGQKIPRLTIEASGRTALNANINIHEQKPPVDPDSPLAFSMEGARKKIPLPLISAPRAPKWHSVQASLKYILGSEGKANNAFGGVRLFKKGTGSFKEEPFRAKELPSNGNFYVVPKYNIFASFSKARFSKNLNSRMPEVEAEISVADAQKLGFSGFAPIILESEHGKFSLLAKTKEDIAEGVMLLPYGLVDAALFFRTSFCRVVSKEQV